LDSPNFVERRRPLGPAGLRPAPDAALLFSVSSDEVAEGFKALDNFAGGLQVCRLLNASRPLAFDQLSLQILERRSYSPRPTHNYCEIALILNVVDQATDFSFDCL